MGPLRPGPVGAPVTPRFLESWFPPGMRTRVHAHSGAEVFYVVEGEQCVETPRARARIGAGQSHIVAAGPHSQSAPNGRRSIVLLAVPRDAPWMQLRDDWRPTDFCD
jgi:mannose-6-phosphate isomerase-like protein (cupin superfamily)